MSDFATAEEVMIFTGRNYTADEQSRISFLLPMISDALRYEAKKVGKDLDAMV